MLRSVAYYSILVPNTILIYDHMATLTEEISCIWRHPKALSAVLFLLNRYVALLGNVSGVIGEFLPVSVERFHSGSRRSVLLLNKDLAVRHTCYQDKCSFFYKYLSFASYWLFALMLSTAVINACLLFW
ncbi:hypothetical protein DFJ58DRAFT_801325 [Suillus subalutaceus]|uniref:uncharacterized protein n=1 Tax=Suillus subalutaceus TaxID=48586 RepID=UPI001B864CE6|nr:uncharacterized protein DFJ58DRAFT_801325 [Suillus subalutaceus]KAG1845079.1 hypothetical protein DFJ58DRAFT_801325 [Suillus subalutaceus]